MDSRDEQINQLTPAKRALYEIRSLRSRIAELERERREPIAIIGMSLRLPGGLSDAASFWEALASGRDAISEIPADRWPVADYFDPDPDAPGKTSTRYGGFLEDVASFDAPFFGISPRESDSMDPQQRLALELSWEALENAGISPAEAARNSGGVFLALSNSDYGRTVFRDLAAIDTYASTGTAFSVAAGRIAFTLGLRGPAMVIDTACSGSLVAVHLACQSLRLGECDTALAGGVNLILSPEIHVNLSKLRMLAPDGRCKTFDSSADGYGRSEGGALVVLKRLSDALAAGDHIRAVIPGSAVNQDGRSGGLTVPSGSAQESLIRQALKAAGVEAGEIGYLEAHGTGTALGDPIEAHAIAAALAAGRPRNAPLLVGSVKTNLGHLEAAAGIAGLIKVVLSLEAEEIPPHLHLRMLNPHIEWQGVEIPVERRPWKRTATRRLAGVSSFGFSGTNAHVIVEESPLPAGSGARKERPCNILALSGRTEAALEALTYRYRDAWPTAGDLHDVCYTANAGRAHFDVRSAVVAADAEEMRQLLRDGGGVKGMKTKAPEIVFLFPGQGSQYPGMAKELYDAEPVVRERLEECQELLRDELDAPLLEVLWGKHAELLSRTQYCQPALFAVEYALAELWKSYGIVPEAVLGHSVGEYTAACVAGVYSLKAGLQLIAARARLMEQVPGRGVMTAVTANQEVIREALRGLETDVAIAAFNAPASLVISGAEAAVAAAEGRLRASGATLTRLAVSHAFHAPQIAEMEPAFEAVAASLEFSRPSLRIVSSVTGDEISGGAMSDPNYWRLQVRQPVRFQKAMETLAAGRYSTFVEVGPGTTLLGLGRLNLTGEAQWLPSIRKSRGECRQMLESLGRLYVQGADVDWTAFYADRGLRRLPLPTYPFERRRHWLKPSTVPSRIQPDVEWEWIYSSAQRQSSEGKFELDLPRYAERWSALDRLSTAYIIQTLRALGLFRAEGDCITLDSAAPLAGVSDGHRLLFERWLDRLVADGLLVRRGDTLQALAPLPDVDTEALVSAAEPLFTLDRTFLEYTAACGKKLAAIITGRESALETLFPGGSFTRAENLYQRSPLPAYMSSVARAALEPMVRARRSESIQILEIGAGTGGTTFALLPILPPDTTTYHFTDLSDLFLTRAAGIFSAHPFVRYGRLNIEHPPETQGYQNGSMDAVVATNVLHATRDIRVTIEQILALLAPGGLLILCEATTHQPWFDVTTGLIEGWQRFDDGLRAGHPLLDKNAWSRLLAEAGFDKVAAFPQDGSPAEVLAHHIVIARKSPGAASNPQRAVSGRDAEARRGEPSVKSDIPDTETLRQLPHERRQQVLVDLVRGSLAGVLGMRPEDIERQRRLSDLGIDSLMAIGLRNRIADALRLQNPLPATLAFEYPTLDAIAEYLERDVLGCTDGLEAAPAPEWSIENRAGELEHLDEEEAEALLLRKLRSL